MKDQSGPPPPREEASAEESAGFRKSARPSEREGAMRQELSERELEIIGLVAAGLTNQEIAEQLTISKRTVDNHVSNIFTKTGARNRVALLNWAMDNGKICRDGFNCCAIDSRPQE